MTAPQLWHFKVDPPDVDSETSTGIVQRHSVLDASFDSSIVVPDTVESPSHPVFDEGDVRPRLPADAEPTLV